LAGSFFLRLIQVTHTIFEDELRIINEADDPEFAPDTADQARSAVLLEATLYKRDLGDATKQPPA